MEDKELLNQEQCECDDTVQEIDLPSEELMGQIAVQQELERIDIENNPYTEIPKDIMEDEEFKESVKQAYIIGECFHVLKGFGIDYNNNVALISNILQNKANQKLAEIQQMQIQNQQL